MGDLFRQHCDRLWGGDASADGTMIRRRVNRESRDVADKPE
jgi:hypothetical protein